MKTEKTIITLENGHEVEALARTLADTTPAPTAASTAMPIPPPK